MAESVSAAGLAGYLDAPILLTRATRLPHNVARYIDRHNVTKVYVVGGTAAVSDDIMTTIEGLGSRPDVERISGADRYETAAAIAGTLGGPNPTWCGSAQSAAILVNGGDAGRADAVAIGPLAYQLGLPVLLTGADALPEATSSFLEDEKVERVVIVGGATAVSADIIDELIEDVGVVTTRRIAGSSAAGTSVAIAQEMLDSNRCGAVLETNRNVVALVNREATADGITAGPVLGFGLGGVGPVPILLVDDTLPAAVSDYLASTPEVIGGQKTHLSIVAIGGSAVVSAGVMADAVAAAKTSPGLTSTIGFVARTGSTTSNTFTVTFSDDVKLPRDADGNILFLGTDTFDCTDPTNVDCYDGTAFDPTLYRINGTRIEALLADDSAGAGPESETVLERIYVEDRTVSIVLSRDLKNGDVISVASGPKIGANSDMRPLEGSSLTVSVAGPTADRSAPIIEILAPVGETTFDVIVTEPNLLTNADDTTYMDPDGVTVDDVAATAPDEPDENVGRPNAPASIRYTFTADAALEKGDVIEVARNTFLDTGNRGNRLTRFTVAEPKTTFEISTVSIGNVTPTAQASATIAEDMVITAKATGVAAGAAGNPWRIYGYEDPSSQTAPLPAATDIDVEVDTVHNIISYTINKVSTQDPPVSLFHLARELVANDTFAAHFTVSFINAAEQGKDDELTATVAAGVPFDGGESKVAVKVAFNDLVSAIGEDQDLGTSLAGAINHGKPVAANTAETDEGIAVSVEFEAPDRAAYFTYTATKMANLPPRGGTRVIPAGVATGYAHSTDTPDALGSALEILRSLRPDSSLKPFGEDTFANGG